MNNLENEKKTYKKLKYSYNPEVTFEMTKKAGGEESYGWLPAEINWEESSLNEMVKTVSYLPSKLKDGHKVKESVEEVYFLTLDFDKNDPTLEQFKEIWKNTQFSWFLHTTVNHQRTISDEGESIQAIDKFRVIVPLSRTISLKELDTMEEFWIEKFPLIDKTCFDGNRYFKMNPNAITYLHNHTDLEGNVVFLNPDDDQLKVKNKKPGRPKKEEITISLDDEVTLEDGSTKIKVREVNQKTKIFCPYCDHSKRTHPHTHNAFIDLNEAGQYYIFCSSESKTYWQDSREIDAARSKLFWNTSIGAPSMIGFKSANGDGSLYLFKNAADFDNYCIQNNINPNIRDYLPRREIIFNPQRPEGLNDEFYNLFEDSEYMKVDYSSLPRIPFDKSVEELQRRCNVIYEILMNIFGEKKFLERFLNWVAYILQEREKAYTAWLITSKIQGTGKDLMFIRILMPLFGKKQSQLLNGNRIAKNFNKIDMNCFLRGYNEVFSAGNVKENLHRKEMLKDLITAPYQSIEIKGVDTFQTFNFMNFILFSNSQHPIFIDDEDRRFNVIRNEEAKKVSQLEIYRGLDNLEPDIERELPEFANIIFTIEYDTELANIPIESEAKDRLKSLSKDEYEEFAERLKAKDADYFLLDEVFPVTEREKLLNQTRSEIAQMVIDTITSDGAIPARYMSRICKYHFNHNHYKSILDRLKLKGIEETTKRILTGPTKVYECK